MNSQTESNNTFILKIQKTNINYSIYKPQLHQGLYQKLFYQLVSLLHDHLKLLEDRLYCRKHTNKLET